MVRSVLYGSSFVSLKTPLVVYKNAQNANQEHYVQVLDPTTSALIGVVISKLEVHQSHSPPTMRGYIAMLAVSSTYRGKGIATELVRRTIDKMRERGADEVVLETEEGNDGAMKLYERLGFARSKKLWRYYLSGSGAYRLVLHLKRVAEFSGGEIAQEMI